MRTALNELRYIIQESRDMPVMSDELNDQYQKIVNSKFKRWLTNKNKKA